MRARPPNKGPPLFSLLNKNMFIKLIVLSQAPMIISWALIKQECRFNSWKQDGMTKGA